MFRVILLQVLITIIAAIVAGLIVGVEGALSAAAGGTVYTIPSLLFALHLKLVGARQGVSNSKIFVFGALAKVIVTFVFLAVTVRFYADLHWPSMLIGLALASQAMLLAFWKKN